MAVADLYLGQCLRCRPSIKSALVSVAAECARFINRRTTCSIWPAVLILPASSEQLQLSQCLRRSFNIDSMPGHCLRCCPTLVNVSCLVGSYHAYGSPVLKFNAHLPEILCLMLRATTAPWDFSQCGNWANCVLMAQSRGLYWTLRLNGYWPATATLGQHSTDIGSVSACNRCQ